MSSPNPDLPLARSPTSCSQTAENVPNNEIRILDLLPGNGYDDIECDIRVVALNDDELYEALSYVWGKNGNEVAVTVNGHERDVTHNLYAALRQLRHPTRKRALWVDQLCINQWDNDEKAEQVNLMRFIYKRCSQCLIWLGDIVEEVAGFSIQDANTAFDFIRVMAARHRLQELLDCLLTAMRAKELAEPSDPW